MTDPRTGSHGELVPRSGFSRHPAKARIPGGSLWVSHDGLVVLSACENSVLPGTHPEEYGAQWHVSVSRSPARSTPADVRRVVDGFAMPAFDEDNHHPGIARHLWCPLDPAYRSACECKVTEQLIVDGDYEWTTDSDGPCRGCEYQRLFGDPCPLHTRRPER